MKNERTYDELLSAYIDRKLNVDEIRFVEETLLNEPEWKKRYEQILSLRSKMLSLSSSGSSRSLWPSLSRRIAEGEIESQKIEIIPAKLVPVVTVLIMIIVGVGSYLITRNWDTVTAYFEDTRVVIEDIYEQGIVKGALQPLFQSVTDDDLIRFAFSGVLEIPETDGKGLKVESEPGDRFELQYADAGGAPDVPTLTELYADLHVTLEQKRSIDSVLTEYKNVIRSSAFVSGDEDIIISPEIAGLDRFIIASIAEQLVPDQRTRFNIILNRFNTDIQVPEAGSFTHVSAPANFTGIRIEIPSPPSPEGLRQIPEGLRTRERTVEVSAAPRKPRERAFIIVKPDTVITGNFEMPDLNLIMERYADSEKIHREIGNRLQRTLQNTRINIQPHIDNDRQDRQIRIVTRVERPGKPDDIPSLLMKTDSLMIDRYYEDHFVRLRELSKILQHQSDTIRHRFPVIIGDDTVMMQHGVHPFDESFGKNLQQLEFDLHRLGESLDSLYGQPEKFLFRRDSLFFHLFPDTLLRND